MRSKLNRFRPSPGVVISVIAVFFAIGGIAAAAATIGTNDIKNGAVTKKKLHKNSVNSGKGINGSLKEVDLGFDPTGPAGPPGPPGPPGPGQGFNHLVGASGSASVTADGFMLTEQANGGGVCQPAVLTATEPGSYFESDITNFSSDDADAIAAGAANSEELEETGDFDMGVVIARANDGTGVAAFQYSLDTQGSTCYFAGSAIAG